MYELITKKYTLVIHKDEDAAPAPDNDSKKHVSMLCNELNKLSKPLWRT